MDNVKLPKADSELATRCINAMNNDLETAKIAYSILHEYRYRHDPTMPNAYYKWKQFTFTVEYRQKSTEDKAKAYKKMCDLSTEIPKYLYSRGQIKVCNMQSVMMLKFMCEVFANEGMQKEVREISRYITQHSDNCSR